MSQPPSLLTATGKPKHDSTQSSLYIERPSPPISLLRLQPASYRDAEGRLYWHADAFPSFNVLWRNEWRRRVTTQSDDLLLYIRAAKKSKQQQQQQRTVARFPMVDHQTPLVLYKIEKQKQKQKQKQKETELEWNFKGVVVESGEERAQRSYTSRRTSYIVIRGLSQVR